MLENRAIFVVKLYNRAYHNSREVKNMKMALNEKLKILRKELKLSQEYVANALGISRTVVTTIESGTRKVTSDELKAFSELYGVTLDELMYDKDVNNYAKKFARIFSELSDLDKKEIMNLIEFKKKIKNRDSK
ncbi:helix-turn-helix domain-containing protein [Clostridium chromiireducens]|uniref:Helix-turn-helix domain-containing protein n=2 Tax=Clostridium chromiireducens TaxID=225345 RepID=A0A964RQT3_9CLOT|nr:helix-turn-helix domain-containing protein [Clostridium chromiireducens]